MADDVQIVNGIAMPPLYNKRAGKMWDIISAHVDFAGKRVIDLGCGRGDLLVRAYAAGAREVFGVDKDQSCVEDARYKGTLIHAEPKRFLVGVGDIRSIEIEQFDIAICCSVLPYLGNTIHTLDKIHKGAGALILECQYDGDGPGLKGIDSDSAMAMTLHAVGWRIYEAIGRTFVEGRDKWRTIWKCER